MPPAGPNPGGAGARMPQWRQPVIPPAVSLLPTTGTFPGTKPGQTRPPATATPSRPVRSLRPGVQYYGGYTADQLTKNPALVAKLGPSGAAKWAAANKGTAAPTAPSAAGTTPGSVTKPISNPFVPSPGGPSPGGPATGQPTNPWSPPPVPSGGYPQGGGAYSSGLPGDVPEPYAYNDPFSSFLAAVPLMNLNRDQQIADAMATAGFGASEGNRFGSWAGGKAAEIGAQNSMAQNQLLLQTLSDYANQQENRALQATGLGLSTGQALDQMQQDRLKLPFAVGSWEQGRQDDYSRQAYDDFERNKLGWLSFLGPLAASQGSGTPGTVYSTTSAPAKPGVADWASALGPLLNLFI
jgi:hypothetical protein